MTADGTAIANVLTRLPARRLAVTAPPMAGPEAPAALADRRSGYDRIALIGVGLPLFAEIFVQKVAIPLGGTTQISATLLFGFAGLALLLASGRAIVDAHRFVLYCAMVTAIVFSQLLGDSPFSTSSLVLMIGTYVIYVFRLRDQPGTFRATMTLYQRMTVIVAGAAVFQYAGQFVLPHDVVFPLEYLLGPFLIKKFAHLIPITYGSPIFKSNGMVLAEPSFLSQAMALSFIVERLFFRRLGFQLAYLAGLTVSYSGTGLMLLAVAGPFLLYRTGALRLLLILLPVAGVLMLLGDLLHLNVVAGRTAEFGAQNSSGFARFISIFYLLDQFIFIDVSRFLFGMGAGSIETVSDEVTYLAHDPTWGKVLFEYGLLGGLGFFPFILYSMIARSASRFLAACLAFAYFFLGGNLLGPFYNFLIVAMVAWHHPDPTLADDAASPAPGPADGPPPRADGSIRHSPTAADSVPAAGPLPRFCP